MLLVAFLLLLLAQRAFPPYSNNNTPTSLGNCPPPRFYVVLDEVPITVPCPLDRKEGLGEGRGTAGTNE